MKRIAEVSADEPALKRVRRLRTEKGRRPKRKYVEYARVDSYEKALDVLKNYGLSFHRKVVGTKVTKHWFRCTFHSRWPDCGRAGYISEEENSWSVCQPEGITEHHEEHREENEVYNRGMSQLAKDALLEEVLRKPTSTARLIRAEVTKDPRYIRAVASERVTEKQATRFIKAAKMSLQGRGLTSAAELEQFIVEHSFDNLARNAAKSGCEIEDEPFVFTTVEDARTLQDQVPHFGHVLLTTMTMLRSAVSDQLAGMLKADATYKVTNGFNLIDVCGEDRMHLHRTFFAGIVADEAPVGVQCIKAWQSELLARVDGTASFTHTMSCGKIVSSALPVCFPESTHTTCFATIMRGLRKSSTWRAVTRPRRNDKWFQELSTILKEMQGIPDVPSLKSALALWKAWMESIGEGEAYAMFVTEHGTTGWTRAHLPRGMSLGDLESHPETMKSAMNGRKRVSLLRALEDLRKCMRKKSMDMRPYPLPAHPVDLNVYTPEHIRSRIKLMYKASVSLKDVPRVCVTLPPANTDGELERCKRRVRQVEKLVAHASDAAIRSRTAAEQASTVPYPEKYAERSAFFHNLAVLWEDFARKEEMEALSRLSLREARGQLSDLGVSTAVALPTEFTPFSSFLTVVPEIPRAFVIPADGYWGMGRSKPGVVEDVEQFLSRADYDRARLAVIPPLQYIRDRSRFWVVQQVPGIVEWECSCPLGMQYNCCEHILFAASVNPPEGGVISLIPPEWKRTADEDLVVTATASLSVPPFLPVMLAAAERHGVMLPLPPPLRPPTVQPAAPMIKPPVQMQPPHRDTPPVPQPVRPPPPVRPPMVPPPVAHLAPPPPEVAAASLASIPTSMPPAASMASSLAIPAATSLASITNGLPHPGQR